MSRYHARPPAVSTVLPDDAMVRITRGDFAPGADTGQHVHRLGYVVVPMTDCHFSLEEETGASTAFVTKGAACRREAGVAHHVVNGGGDPMSFIEIESK